jgi:GntR family transcriptional regulator
MATTKRDREQEQERHPEYDAPIPTKNLPFPGSPRVIIADALRDRIKRGVYPPRTLLPSLAELEKMTNGSARGTIRQALKVLAAEGYIRSTIGIGAQVLDPDYWPGGKKHDELPE